MRRWMVAVLAAGIGLPLGLMGCGGANTPDFALSLASGQTSAASVSPGAQTNVAISVSSVKGSAGSITLVLSGLPTGVGVAPGSATVGIGSTQTFVLTAAAAAPLTSAPVTLTATGVSGNALSSDSITHTQTLTLSVVAPTP